MLGAPCSPCCGPPECDNSSVQQLFDVLQSKTARISVSSDMPYQDAATFSLSAIRQNPFGGDPAQFLTDNANFLYYAQEQQLTAGWHDLSLDMAATGLFFHDSGEAYGVVAFKKQTDGYLLRFRIGIRTPLWEFGSFPENRFFFDNSACACFPSGRVELYRRYTAFWTNTAYPSGITTKTRPFSYGGPQGQLTVAYVNAPYYATDFLDITGVQGVTAWWPSSYKPSGVSWTRSAHGVFRWDTTASVSTPESLATFSSNYQIAGEGLSLGSAHPLSRWQDSTANDQGWKTNLTVSDQVNVSSPVPRFDVTFDLSPKAYVSRGNDYSARQFVVEMQ